MYQDKIVTAIKVGGKILREQDATVTLPFGCEYSILVKNLNSVRVQFTVSVDGQDATEGTRLILAPNSSLELERFIRNGNLQAGNRFKFIERTAAIEDHRGIGMDDGIIRIEAWREHVQKFVNDYPRHPPYPSPRPRYTGSRRPGTPQMRGPSGSASRPARPGGMSARSASLGNAGLKGMQASSTMGAMASMGDQERGHSDAGITVSGSESRQQFQSVSGFSIELQSTVIVLHLRGEVAGATVSVPVTVSAKPECSTCGRKNKGGSQFCSQCGTALALI